MAILGSAGRSLHEQFAALKDPGFVTPDYDLLLVLKGKGGYKVNGKKQLVGEGDLVLLKPGDRCVPFLVSGHRFDRFFIHFDLLSRGPRAVPVQVLSWPRVFNINQDPELKRLCFCIVREFYEGEEGKLLVHHYLSELLIRLYFREAPSSRKKKRRVNEKHFEKLNQVLHELNFNFSQKNSLVTLSARVGLSLSHLLRLFKEEYGTSIHQYLLNKRLEQAKLLLLENRMKGAEIARLVGFDSAQHFSSIFKEKTGLTPAGYVSRVFQSSGPRLPGIS